MYSLYYGVELELRIVAGASLIQYARNQLVREFLEDESFTHIMWIDADVGFDPRAIMKLLGHKKDVVGGVYPMKCVPMDWPYEPMPGEQQAELHRAKIMPGGFLLCSRKAIETVCANAERYWHYTGGMRYWTPHVFDLVLENKTLLGEDVIFSRRLIEAGLDIWCDPDLHFQHCGKFEWRGNLADAIRQGIERPPIDPVLIQALRADPHSVQAAADLHGAWGNTWAAPPMLLHALARLATRPGVRRILETGCGVSTLLMAAVNPDAEVHALEDSADWAARVQAEAERHGLTNITIHRCPLSPEDWFYKVPEGLPDSFDLVFHDGPAFMEGGGLSHITDPRRPFYAKLAGRIRDAILVVDDAEYYEDEIKDFRHETVGGRFAICLPRPKKASELVRSSAA